MAILGLSSGPSRWSRNAIAEAAWGDDQTKKWSHSDSPLKEPALTGLAASLYLGNQIWFSRTSHGKESIVMPRPAAKELTARELEVMQVYWTRGELTAATAR